MSYETITVSNDGGLAIVTMNRPEKMNSLNAQMRAELTDAFRSLPETARCIVLTGEGRAFCTGQDLNDRGSGANADLERTLREEYAPMLKAIYGCKVPTIAAVNGPAAGAGANLALATDIVIASEDAYFLQAFAKIGLMPDAAGTWFLPRQIGMAKAMGAALFADKISAKQADDWGMIWAAVAADDFDAHWRARASELANGPTQAYHAIKTAMRGSFDATIEDQLGVEAQLQGRLGKSRDFTEGVLAFLEKRPAKFEGR
jgi:2-(1,2-epoxy-1,2-dihydrophenyl)acetyl-CoA isomerase